MRIKTNSIAIATLLLATIGSNAYAVDPTDLKVMPSAACQGKGFNEAAKLTFFEDALKNSSSSDAFVICSFVKDNVNNGIGKTYSAIVEVQGSNGKNVFCTLTSRSRSGKFLADDFETGGANGATFLALNIKQPNNFNSSYSITCILPPNGRIFGYTTSEPSPTD
ncbi:hypothetical protein [Merismopedia glauca]|uniref:Uncharacterized protein n=2 Tax=Merismopedia TaxID=53402 RepID=A0A2T1C3U2_9CYAN|nr:hypothetical protein [Merismopedia glauca]PSB02926.1 hypothetical protein C7B64_10785 [Merismopedia glauca CCAP 1448/3]